MEILGNVEDITIKKGEEKKIKIRTVDEKDIIVDKIEILTDKEGKIIKQ